MIKLILHKGSLNRCLNMIKNKYTVDFETTTDENDCRVWATGICLIGGDFNFIHGNNIEMFFEFAQRNNDADYYFHNLKFDGEFIFYWLLTNGFKYTEGIPLEENTFTTLISDSGQFYSISIRFDNNVLIKIFDSLKILPFSVDNIAKAFNLPIKKLEIDYLKYRPIEYKLDNNEIDYLKNDVEIVARALDVLFKKKLTKITQGSNALYDYKRVIGGSKRFEKLFPTPSPNYDADIRRAYRGGFTYLNPIYANKELGEGIVLDVNSLYPSVMYSMPLPYAEGVFFNGKYQKDEIYDLYIQKISCVFELKDNYLPTIQLKNNLSFIPTEYITSSNNEEITLYLTNVDLKLFKEHYKVDSNKFPNDINYINGWKFRSHKGLFRDYIDKWNTIKVESTKSGNMGMRTLAKLMLNALYGKFGSKLTAANKIPYLSEKGIVKYKTMPEKEKKGVYIPVAVFITSWARYITISSAQKLYDRFIYADTDSLHLIGVEIPSTIKIDDTELGCWKHESTFTRAKFLRAKTYIEEIDNKLMVTTAGMPKKCHSQVNFDNFTPGSVYTGKLTPKHVKGGIILQDTEFTIKKH